MYNSPWEYRSLLRALFTRLVDDRRSSQISIRRQTITNLILRSVCASISTVSYCIFDLHASGWTLFSQKREFLRPSQQVMVTMSKQVGSLFYFYFSAHRWNRYSTNRLCASRMQRSCSTWCAFLLYVIFNLNDFFSGARGTSVLFSSGDGGVGDGISNPLTQTCITNDGKNRTRFMANFPASCPL